MVSNFQSFIQIFLDNFLQSSKGVWNSLQGTIATKVWETFWQFETFLTHELKAAGKLYEIWKNLKDLNNVQEKKLFNLSVQFAEWE